MKATIVLIPGDGIGPEIVSAAELVLGAAAKKYNHQFDMQEYLMGGCAIDKMGDPLPPKTLSAAKNADAILLGAVGGPKWDDPNAKVRPEGGLLGLRKGLGLYANLRPVRPHELTIKASPLRPERLEDVDLLVVRELTGGIYFGQPRKRYNENGEDHAVDTMVYSESEVSRIAHLAFQLAGNRRKKVTSVDKANVLESSRLWRNTVIKVAKEYPDIQLEHVLVDAATMFLLTRPSSFDVILTTNMFGDILSDEASVLAGSMGLLPSASLGEDKNSNDFPRGLFEPIHGSAPDIAGKGIANPAGTILSAAMLLRYSLGLEAEAKAVEKAVDAALSFGHVTPDLAAPGEGSLNTKEMAKTIAGHLQRSVDN
jgi:3-isopropylmalate dehydrogenase